MNEGWAWPQAGRTWHYFRNDLSLCKRYSYSGALQQGNDQSPDNCTFCMKALLKEKEKARR